MAEHRYCEDCVWFRPVKTLWWRGSDQTYARCLRPEADSRNVIARNGEGTYCSVQRRFPPCGPEGKLWEQA